MADVKVRFRQEGASSVTSAANSVMSSLGGVAGAAIGLNQGLELVQKAIGAVTDTLKALINAAANAEEVWNRVGDQVKIATGKFDTTRVKAFSKELEHLTTYSDTQLGNAFGTLIQLTGDQDKAFRGTKIAANIAASGIMDVTAATLIVARAMETGTARIGRMSLTLDELDVKFAGMAEGALKTFNGQWTLLVNTLGNLKEDLGQPITDNLLPWLITLNKVVTNVEAGLHAITDWMHNNRGLAAIAETLAFPEMGSAILSSYLMHKAQEPDKDTIDISGTAEASMYANSTRLMREYTAQHEKDLTELADQATKQYSRAEISLKQYVQANLDAVTAIDAQIASIKELELTQESEDKQVDPLLTKRQALLDKNAGAIRAHKLEEIQLNDRLKSQNIEINNLTTQGLLIGKTQSEQYKISLESALANIRAFKKEINYQLPGPTGLAWTRTTDDRFQGIARGGSQDVEDQLKLLTTEQLRNMDLVSAEDQRRLAEARGTDQDKIRLEIIGELIISWENYKNTVDSVTVAQTDYERITANNIVDLNNQLKDINNPRQLLLDTKKLLIVTQDQAKTEQDRLEIKLKIAQIDKQLKNLELNWADAGKQALDAMLSPLNSMIQYMLQFNAANIRGINVLQQMGREIAMLVIKMSELAAISAVVSALGGGSFKSIFKFLGGFDQGGRVPLYASGGLRVPSRGTDRIPALLSPGEYVIDAETTRNNPALIGSLSRGRRDSGNIINMNFGPGWNKVEKHFFKQTVLEAISEAGLA